MPMFQLSAVLLPGNHIVMVTVANGLGSILATLNVSVQYPITIHHIAANPVTLGRPFVLEVVFTGDLDLAVTVDYGDGNYVNSSSAIPHPDITVTPLSDSSQNASAPVYLLKLRHVYMSAGDYVLSLSVANKVSHVTRSLTAKVADEDFNVTLTADCRSTVASNSFVSVSAMVTMSEEEAVTFSWMCDQCVEMPLVHRSVVLHSWLHVMNYFIHSFFS